MNRGWTTPNDHCYWRPTTTEETMYSALSTFRWRMWIRVVFWAVHRRTTKNHRELFYRSGLVHKRTRPGSHWIPHFVLVVGYSGWVVVVVVVVCRKHELLVLWRWFSGICSSHYMHSLKRRVLNNPTFSSTLGVLCHIKGLIRAECETRNIILIPTSLRIV